MNESNNSSIKINSTARSPEDQARIMSENVEGQGMKSQRALYGSRGQNVLDKHPNQEAMVKVINDTHGQQGLKHVADPNKVNVIDFSPIRGGIKSTRFYKGCKKPRFCYKGESI